MGKPAKSSSSFIDIGSIDRYLAEHGSFTVLDWLLAQGTLAYGEYAAWREGRRETLDGALSLPAPEIDRLLAEVDSGAKALNLTAEPKELFAWSGSSQEPLRASNRLETHRRLVQQWRRAAQVPQFDLFMDNAPGMAERRLCEAIGGRRYEEAARELDALSRLDPANKSLGNYQDLINYGRHVQTPAPATQAELRVELDALEQEVQPLTRSLLAGNARDYLSFAWQRLAQGLGALPGDEFDERLHPSHALAQIPDWEAVRLSLAAEPGLLRFPAWMQRLARACRATGKSELGLLWWLVCIDRYPQDSPSILKQCDDPALLRLLAEYSELEYRTGYEMPESGFPGFVLLRRPGLIQHLEAVPPLQCPESRAMMRLIKARQQGADEISLRKALAEINPGLLSMYLAVRA
jgi:hypothetical protein